MGKLIYIIVDGMADLPIKNLGGKTPLEYAYKPNTSFFLRHSVFGYPSVLGRYAPQSDSGVMADLGYDPLKYSTGRGWFECLGLGMSPEDGQLAVRVNFGAVSNSMLKAIRVYMSKGELEELEGEINDKVRIDADFDFKIGEGYRAGLVIRQSGKKLSAFISNGEPGYIPKFYPNGRKIGLAVPINSKKVNRIKAMRKEAVYTSELLNDFVSKASSVIKKSRVYRDRKEKREEAPNFLFLRDGAVEDPRLPDITGLYGKKWAAVVGMPLEKGISAAAGMTVVDTGELQDVRTDFYNKSEKLSAALKRFDAVYLHIKQTDSVSHLGKYSDKYSIIESLDRIILGELSRKFDFDGGDTLILTCDHATSSELKRHINSKIPVLISNVRFGPNRSFGESMAEKEHAVKIRSAVDILPFASRL